MPGARLLRTSSFGIALVLDIVFVASGIAFFVVSAGYAVLCDQL